MTIPIPPPRTHAHMSKQECIGMYTGVNTYKKAHVRSCKAHACEQTYTAQAGIGEGSHACTQERIACHMHTREAGFLGAFPCLHRSDLPTALADCSRGRERQRTHPGGHDGNYKKQCPAGSLRSERGKGSTWGKRPCLSPLPQTGGIHAGANTSCWIWRTSSALNAF